MVYERYFDGSDRGTLETSFSAAAKSFASTLVGIAIDEGLISAVDDPVTDYLPELAARDPRFDRITLRDLLTMSSGLRYSEAGFPWPFGDGTNTYYGVERPGNFYAFGKYGQYIYVAPDADAVIVRTGSDWGVDNGTWLAIFRNVTDQLAEPPGSGTATSD